MLIGSGCANNPNPSARALKFSQTSVMEGIPYIGIVKKESEVEKLVSLLIKEIKVNKYSVCYVSKLRGGAEPAYNVSYNLNKDNGLDITLIKPNKIIIGTSVLNKQVICFTPLNKFKINSINLMEI
jgi:hypothetical protein